MVTSKTTLNKIREIIERNYSKLMISVLGRDVLTPKELEELEDHGVDTSNDKSLLSLVYHHSFINNPSDVNSPQSVRDMENQQDVSGLKPQGQAIQYTTENMNDKTKQYIEKLRHDVTTRLEAIVRENNDDYKRDALKNLNRSDFLDEMVKESSLGKVKQKLRDTSGQANRDWNRIAATELSNAVGIASVDRIVSDNREADLHEIYVFRITVKDSKTCRHCRRFYQDADGSPALYRLSTLLANGSNYGKKPDSWNAVAVATHPQERCSSTLELKPGFALTSSGAPTYIGLDKWQDYLANKLRK